MQQKQSFWKRLFCVCEDEESIMASKQGSKSIEKNPSIKHQHYTETQTLTPQKVESQLGFSLQSDYFQPEIIDDNEFVLNKSHELCIYQKNSKVNFTYPQKPYWSEPTNIFELYYTKSLHLDIKPKYIAPQQFCKYLAKRLGSGTTLLEIDSFINQHSIQFALAGLNVISLCKNQKFIEIGHQNLKAYRVEMQVQQLEMDFLNFKFSPSTSKMIDKIFLNISTVTSKQINSREIMKTIKKALSICENLIILSRSKVINIHVIEILCELMNDENYSKTIWLEAECIYINDVREFTVYYIGSIAKVNEKDFLLEIQKRLLIDKKIYNNFDMTVCLYNILSEVNKKIGPVKLMKIYYEVFQSDKSDQLIKFMNKISGSQILSNQEIKQICICSNINRSKQVSIQQGNENTSQYRKAGTGISNNKAQTISYSFEMSYDLNFQSELFALPDTFSTNK